MKLMNSAQKVEWRNATVNAGEMHYTKVGNYNDTVIEDITVKKKKGLSHSLSNPILNRIK